MHPGYAESLAQFGTPRRLPRSSGWILVRQIPGSDQQLYLDLEEMGDELVSLAVVADPFGHHRASCLHECFKDVVIPFKEHFVIDLKRSVDTFVCTHHRRYARKALRNLYVERCDEPEIDFESTDRAIKIILKKL